MLNLLKNHPVATGRDIILYKKPHNDTIISRFGVVCFYFFATMALNIFITGLGICLQQALSAFNAFRIHLSGELTYSEFMLNKPDYEIEKLLAGSAIMLISGISYMVGRGFRYVLSGF